MHDERSGGKRKGRDPAAAETRRDRRETDRKGEHTRVEISFERVDSRFKQTMAEGQGEEERGAGPRRGVVARADRQHRDRKYGSRQQKAEEEHRREIRARRDGDSRDDVVAHSEPGLRVDEGAVSWKEGGCDEPLDGGNVERLIADTKAVAGGVRRHEDRERWHEDDAKCQRPLPWAADPDVRGIDLPRETHDWTRKMKRGPSGPPFTSSSALAATSAARNAF